MSFLVHHRDFFKHSLPSQRWNSIRSIPFSFRCGAASFPHRKWLILACTIQQCLVPYPSLSLSLSRSLSLSLCRFFFFFKKKRPPCPLNCRAPMLVMQRADEIRRENI